MRKSLAILQLALVFAVSGLRAEFPEPVFPFLETHCYECHDDLSQEGGLNLLDLDFDPTDPHNLAIWAKAHDRATSGEMPPEEQPRPGADELKNFAAVTSESLEEEWKKRYASSGRTQGRRLNPTEFEHTLHDLLDAPWLELKEMLPPDPSVAGFDNVAEAQELSYVQMARYLEAAEVAIDGAMQLRPPHEAETVRTWFSQEGRYLGKDEFEGLGTGDIRPVGDWTIFFRQPNSAQDTYHIKNTSPRVPGWYRFRVRARAVHYDNGELSAPKQGQVAVINTEAKRVLGEFDVPEGPEGGIVEFTAWQHEKELLDFFCATLDDFDYPNKKKDPTGPLKRDGIGIDWFEISGPFANEDCAEGVWPPESYRRLFGDLATAPWTEASGLKPPQPLNLPDLTANRFGLRETYQLPPEMMMVVSENPEADAERLLRDFMARAYRGKPEESEVQRCLAFALEAIAGKACFQDAMRPAFKAVLCSPDFLYFREDAGALDDFALASRLSYLLWRSMPDAALLEDAAAGRLSSPEGLHAAFTRLLDDPKAERFIEDFAGQWLELHAVHETSPDRYLFPEYFCDTHLVDSGVAETVATFDEMLHQNLPAKTIVAADFVMINERLAELYGIDGVRGREIRRVELPAGSVRGGLLTQSSILKVTANGLTSSPVIRGAWVIEQILGTPASAPPPDAGAIEPDTQGAKTIRELLALHSREESCASCHVRIDPPGFALESFDVMGAWRESYRSFGEGEKVNLEVAGRQVRYKTGLPVDPSGVTEEGEPFSDIHEFRDYLLSQERQLARNLTKRFVTFATGATVSFSDRKTVEAILDATEADGYPVKDLLEAVVLNELFRFK